MSTESELRKALRDLISDEPGEGQDPVDRAIDRQSKRLRAIQQAHIALALPEEQEEPHVGAEAAREMAKYRFQVIDAAFGTLRAMVEGVERYGGVSPMLISVAKQDIAHWERIKKS